MSHESFQCCISSLSLDHFPVSDNDYIGILGDVIHLNEFNSNQVVFITINNDTDLESDEQFFVYLELLGNPEDVTIAINNVSILILDDECK